MRDIQTEKIMSKVSFGSVYGDNYDLSWLQTIDDPLGVPGYPQDSLIRSSRHADDSSGFRLSAVEESGYGEIDL